MHSLNTMLVFFEILIAVVLIKAEIITYSSNDPGLKKSLILYDGSFDNCKFLDCRQGRCDPMEQVCVCDIGWTGKLCDITASDQPRTILSNVHAMRQRMKDKGVLSKILEQLNMINIQERNAAHVPKDRQRPRERLFVEITDGVVVGVTEALPAFNSNVAHSFASSAPDKPSKNNLMDSAEYMTYDSKPKGSTWVDVGLFGSTQNTAEDASKHNFPNHPKIVMVDTNTVNSFTATSSQDVCSSSYQLRPDNDRKCQFGFRCMYGACSSDSNSKQITFQCKCDPGALGLFCEQKCCLNCGQNGHCDVKPDGKQFCFCRRGFTGQTCEIAVYL